MANIDFYYFVVSPFCRSILYEAKLIDLKLNLKTINLLKGENKSEEYLKINPHHKVPTIVDGDLNLAESRAIMVYLFNKYAQAKHEYLYPRDLKKRAKIDQFLYYSTSSVAPALLSQFRIVVFEKRKPNEEEMKKFDSALEELNNCYFENSTYLFGEKPTLADLDLAAILSQVFLLDFDFSKYPKLNKFANAIKKADWATSYDAELKKLSDPFVKEVKATLKA